MKLTLVILFTDKDKDYAKIFYDNAHLPANAEMLLVDNCTVPSTFYKKKPGINYLKLPNIPVVCARKQSIQYCNGEYIWFVDADDMYYNIAAVAKSDLTADWYYCSYDIVEKLNGKLSHFTPVNRTLPSLGGLWNKIIKKSVLEYLYSKIPDYPIQTLEDTIIVDLMLVYKYKCEYLNIKVYQYNQYLSHVGNNIHKYFEGLKDIFDLIFEKFEFDTNIKSELCSLLFYGAWGSANKESIHRYYNGDYSKYSFLCDVIPKNVFMKIKSNPELKNWLLKNGNFSLAENKYCLKVNN